MIIAIDFDSCIAHYNGWKGIDAFGTPIEGVSEALTDLKNQGHRIIIHTCRIPTLALQNYLKTNNIPFDDINENPWSHLDNDNPNIKRKIQADVYVDDKAIIFTGNWEETLQDILNFKPWETDSDLIEKGEGQTIDKIKNHTFLIEHEMPPCCRGRVHALLYTNGTWERYIDHTDDCTVVEQSPPSFSLRFREPDIENCRKEMPERVKSIKKFNDFVDGKNVQEDKE